MRGRPFCVAAAITLAGCTGTPSPIATYQPTTGVNEVLRGPIGAAPGHELVIGDLVMAPGFEIPAHFHHGEEFLYVIGGSAILERPGLPSVTMGAGQSIRIPPGTVHSGRVGADGLRAVSSWVVPNGKPLRVPVSQ